MSNLIASLVSFFEHALGKKTARPLLFKNGAPRRLPKARKRRALCIQDLAKAYPERKSS